MASAIFASEEAQSRGQTARIALFDGAAKPGAKILVSGGGRCNVTNAVVTENDYCGGSPRIIRNVLRRFSAADTAAWITALGVDLKEEEPWGKLFPVTDSARTVLDALMTRVRLLGVETRFGFRVADLRRGEANAQDSVANWEILSESGEVVTARRVIVATGGKALPKSGSDGAGYEWLRRLGHTIVPPVPALAPLVLNERGAEGSALGRYFGDLSGVSIEATLFYGDGQKGGGVQYSGPVLFTHFGISGPVAMNISRHLARARVNQPEAPGRIALTFGFITGAGATRGVAEARDVADKWLLATAERWPRATLGNVLRREMPERVAQVVAGQLAEVRMTDLAREERLWLARALGGSELTIKSDRGFAFAEATAGGVALDEINWRTMESRKAPGLFLCGEVLDVDGRIGGYNFQWAWSSGNVAGKAAASEG